MVRLLVIVACLAGCDRVFGESYETPDASPIDDGPVDSTDAPRYDRDSDGIFDDEDACIAPLTEVDHDEDNDSITASLDRCPFHNPNNGNDDNDMLDDSCDSLRGVGGGTRRCAMSFTASALNAALWIPGAAGDVWNRGNGQLTIAPSIGPEMRSIFAVEDLLGTERPGTVSASIRVAVSASTEPGNFVLWMTATEDGLPDAGCRLRFDSGDIDLDVVGAAVAPVQVVQAGAVTIELRASYLRGLDRTTLTCATVTPGNPRSIEATVDTPPRGAIGFGTMQWGAAVEWLEIFEHP